MKLGKTLRSFEEWAARRGPRAAVRGAELAANFFYFVKRGCDRKRFVPSEDVINLLGPMEERQAREISRGIFIRQKLNLALRTIVGDGGTLDGLGQVIEMRNFDFIRERAGRKLPTVIVEWHCGPLVAINAALTTLKTPVVKLLVQHYFEMPKEWIVLKVDQELANETAMLKQALKHVRSGKIAALACDSVKKSHRAVWLPVLGSRAPFQRGAMTLATLADAPAVPVCAWWDLPKRKLVVESLDPLHPQDYPAADKPTEDRLLEAFAARFESYLQKHPMDASKRVYTSLLKAKAQCLIAIIMTFIESCIHEPMFLA